LIRKALAAVAMAALIVPLAASAASAQEKDKVKCLLNVIVYGEGSGYYCLSDTPPPPP